jgi:hypothetical protein
MSFEGRYQKLCPNGHYEEQCVYLETSKCGECGSKWMKSNLVDDTNEPGEGYDESMVPKLEKPGLRSSFALFLADYKARESK